MGSKCSICTAPGLAEAVNGMRKAGKTLDEISSACGVHRSSVARHLASCYLRQRAVELKNQKLKGKTGRLIVHWAAGMRDGKEQHYTTMNPAYGGSDLRSCLEVEAYELRADDLVIDVVFESRNPR